jgi:alanine-glyoxylate transaminase / serine-glyoxylate transaminase / serine-pyruvate transaminase
MTEEDMDPAYFKVMDEVVELLKYLFQTDNEFTIPVSGSGRCVIVILL